MFLPPHTLVKLKKFYLPYLQTESEQREQHVDGECVFDCQITASICSLSEAYGQVSSTPEGNSSLAATTHPVVSFSYFTAGLN